MPDASAVSSFAEALVLGEIHDSIARVAYRRGAYGYALFED